MKEEPIKPPKWLMFFVRPLLKWFLDVNQKECEKGKAPKVSIVLTFNELSNDLDFHFVDTEKFQEFLDKLPKEFKESGSVTETLEQMPKTEKEEQLLLT